MELTMAAQEDSTPWEMPGLDKHDSKFTSSSAQPDLLHGRGYFSALGQVRGKPSRPDAPPTLSKSCSDKLALKQSTSLLSSITSLLISPQNAYLTSLVLPSPQYSETACTRAFSPSGRLAPLTEKTWGGGYAFREFKILTTEKEFAYSRRQVLKLGEKLVPSNIASVSGPRPENSETLIGGTLQGRKQFSLPGASRASKQRIWQLAISVAALACGRVLVDLDRTKGENCEHQPNCMDSTLREEKNEKRLFENDPIVQCLKVETYTGIKEGKLLRERRRVKREVREMALKGWVKNDGGESFGCDGLLNGT
jgi:tRNA-specific adenosine deaminase 1